MEIRVKNIPENLASLLTTNSEAKIHSIFDTGLNIKVNDHIIFLGKRQGPTSLYLNHLILKRAHQNNENTPVIINGGSIEFPLWDLTVLIDTKNTINYEIKNIKKDIQRFQDIKSSLLEANFELGFEKNTIEMLQFLFKKFENLNDLVPYLIGRGLGLTPSGDDFITGMLAHHHMSPYLDDTFINEIIKLKNKTNEISISFINEAIEGRFNKTVLDLYNPSIPLANSINNLSHFGNHSGKDTLAGILMGILISQKEKL